MNPTFPHIKTIRGNMRTIKIMIAAASLLLWAAGCSGAKQEKAMEKNQKALVVFFSHAGENYAVGNVEKGNTKIVADYITELTGADQFEIVTHKYDSMAYMPLTSVAKEESEKGEMPEYEGEADLSAYDTIFIGGPIWWGTYPRVMFTFFEKHAGELKGKTVIPYTTHEGSGLGNSEEDVREAFPEAEVLKGFSIYGHEVRTNKDKVEKWLKGLGY
jgi:flavodoxin